MSKIQLGLCIVWLMVEAIAQDVRNQLAPIPDTGFVCTGKIAGFYADPHPLVNCRIYHLCNIRGGKSSFSCPNGTAFHQQFLICAHAHEVNCSMATKFYHVNNNVFPVTRSALQFLASTSPPTTPTALRNAPQQNRLPQSLINTPIKSEQNFIQRTPISQSFTPKVTVPFRNDLNTIQQTRTTQKPPQPRATVPLRSPVQPIRTAVTTSNSLLSRVTVPFRNDLNSIQPTRRAFTTSKPSFSAVVNGLNTVRQTRTFVTTQQPLAVTRAGLPFRNDITRVTLATPRPLLPSATVTFRNDHNTIQQDDPLDELLVPSPARRRHLSTPRSTNQPTPQQQQRQNFVTRRIEVVSQTLSVQGKSKANNQFLQSVTPSAQQLSTFRTTPIKVGIPPSKRLPIPPAMIDMLEKQMREKSAPVTTSSNRPTQRDVSGSFDVAANRWRLPINRKDTITIPLTTQLPLRTTQNIQKPHGPFETPARKLPLNLPIQRQPFAFGPASSRVISQESDVIPNKNSFTEKYEEFRTTIDPNNLAVATPNPNAAFGARERPLPGKNWTPSRDVPSNAAQTFGGASSVTKNFLPPEALEWESHLTMKFPKKSKVVNKKLSLNPSCPQCDPFYLDAGKCTPCIIIRR